MAVLNLRTNNFCCWLIIILLTPSYVMAENLLLPEDKIKAGLLYNFLKYTDWPDKSLSSTILCVYGSDPFKGLLAPMDGRTANRKKILLRFIKNKDEVSMCNLVFINKNLRSDWPELKNFLKDKPILTVSDFESFTDLGGIIEFTKKNNNIQAKLNMKALKSANLRVHDSMLKLVKTIE